MNFDRLRSFLDNLGNIGIPGYDMTIHIGYEEVFRHSGGWADREHMRPISHRTIYRLHSCTKIITCVAALQLYEQGKFLMTDYLDNYLPEFRNMTVTVPRIEGGVEERPAANRIRIIDLFRMTSGLDYNRDCPRFRAALETLDPRRETRAVASAIAHKTLRFEPGTHWTYGLSHDVLGALVSLLAGKSLGDAIKDTILDPLHMEDTGFRLCREQRDRLATEYIFDEKSGCAVVWPHEHWDRYGPDYESGGGGLYSTLEDYILFAQALANGGIGADGARILSKRTNDLMRMNNLDAEMQRDFNWIQFRGYGYGLGVRTLVNPAEAGSLSPIGEFGWGGSAGAYTLIDPENRISIFYTQHMLDSKEPYIHPRLRNLAYACLDR